MVNTHNLTADILELVDNFLGTFGIRVPSPEDDEREPDNDAALYGSTYAELMDSIEPMIVDAVERAAAGETIESYIFGT